MRQNKCFLLSALLLFTVLFSSCFVIHGQTPENSDIYRTKTFYNKKLFASGGRAVVIIGNFSDFPRQKHYEKSFYLKNDKGEKILAAQGISQSYVYNKKHTDHIFMLIPGRYELTNFNIRTNARGLTQVNTHQKNDYSFEVKAGEAVYLGCIAVTSRSKKPKNEVFVTLEDFSNNKSSKKLFAAIRKETGKKPEARLMEVHSSGLNLPGDDIDGY